MRYPASEKLEIIRTVEASHLPTRQTLARLGIPSSTHYDWYARWSDGGIDAPADRSLRPASVRNRTPDTVHEDVFDFAQEHELLNRYTVPLAAACDCLFMRTGTVYLFWC